MDQDFNLRRQHGEMMFEYEPFLYRGDSATLINDGAVHDYLLRADWVDFGAMEEPLRMIVTNAGEEASVVVNAVMAGAEPAYLPVILALASSGMTARQSSTSSMANMVVVNGPIRDEIGMNSGLGALGPYSHANATIGRAFGLLSQNRPKLVACTPAGVIELLEREKIPIRGRHAVVIGRSDIVGKPMALLLLHRDATVTICHSRTPDLPSVCRQADILVAAVGRAGLVTKDFVKPGAAVIDVGMNRVTDPAIALQLFPAGHARLASFQAKGSVLVGDVHPEVWDVAGALTPVPGGVGPLTITMLMMNTLRAAQERVGPT